MIKRKKGQLKKLLQHKKRNPNKQTFLQHIQELRSRLTLVAVFFVLTSLGGYFIYPNILSVLFRLYDQQLFYTTPTSGIDLAVKISAGVGVCCSVPIFCYELFQFVKPALPKLRLKNLALFVLTSIGLMLSGMSFAYFVTLPATLHFLTTFHTNEVAFFVSASSYISFVLQYIVVFGLIFQIPLVLISWNAISELEVKRLMHYQTWVFVGCFTIAAIVTPTPDPINQTMMAVPLIVLYECTIVVIYLMNRKKRNRPKTTA